MLKWWDTKYFRLTNSAVVETVHPNSKTRTPKKSCPSLTSLVHNAGPQVLVHYVVLQGWSTVWLCSFGPPCRRCLQQSCPVCCSALLLLQTRQSFSACISSLRPSKCTCANPPSLTPPLLVLCVACGKQAKSCLFVFYKVASSQLIWVFSTFCFWFLWALVDLFIANWRDSCWYLPYVHVIYMQEFVFYFLLFFSCVLFIWLVVGIAA